MLLLNMLLCVIDTCFNNILLKNITDLKNIIDCFIKVSYKLFNY